jgi:hypothetical protein
MYKLYLDLKDRETPPTLAEICMAHDLADPHEVDEHLRILQEKTDRLLECLELVCSLCFPSRFALVLTEHPRRSLIL